MALEHTHTHTCLLQNLAEIYTKQLGVLSHLELTVSLENQTT